MRRGAKIVAAMHEGQALGDRLQVQRPVQSGIAAADDDDIAAAILLHLAHGIEDGLAFVGVDAGDGRALGLERAAAGGDHHRLHIEGLAVVGRHFKARRAIRALLGQAVDHLAEMECRMKRLDLLLEILDESLAGDDREARNVVDRLFRIELGTLPAGFRQDVDEMRPNVEETKFEDREKADRPGANDQYVGFDHIAHYYYPAEVAQPCWGGVVTVSPSSSARTLIWQERREFGFTS